MSILELDLDRSIEQQQIEQLELFKKRFVQLKDNWMGLEGAGISLSGWGGLDEEGKRSSTGLGVDIHRLKGLYVDFRLFLLNDELVNFYKVRKIVESYVHKPPAVKCLESIKKHWQRSDQSTKFCQYSIEDLIDVTFNADVFHVKDRAVIESLAHIREQVSDSLRNQLVVTAIFEKMHAVGKLAWVIEPLTIDYQKIQVPQCFS